MSRLTIKKRESYMFAVCRNGSRLPRFRHDTEDDARADAAEQSAKKPGATFVVLKEVARISTDPNPVTNAPGDRQSRAASPTRRRPAQPGSADE